MRKRVRRERDAVRIERSVGMARHYDSRYKNLW